MDKLKEIEKIISNLLQKKKRLQRKKDKNEAEIKKCEKQIEYYQEMAKSYLIKSTINNHHLAQLRTLAWQERTSIIPVFKSEAQRQANLLERENNSIFEKRNIALDRVSYYESKKRNLQSLNVKISSRIVQIDSELEKSYAYQSGLQLQAKPESKVQTKETGPKLIKRRKTNDRYKVHKRK